MLGQSFLCDRRTLAYGDTDIHWEQGVWNVYDSGMCGIYGIQANSFGALGIILFFLFTGTEKENGISQTETGSWKRKRNVLHFARIPPLPLLIFSLFENNISSHYLSSFLMPYACHALWHGLLSGLFCYLLAG
jgi:hypothetical protein